MAAIVFTTPTCVRAWIEYPFQERGDFTTKIYHHIMQVERDSYAPLAWDDVMTTADEKPTRSPFADDSAAYYVGDTEPQNTDPRMVEFDRMFANVPLSSTEGNGVYSFNYPGVDSTLTDVLFTTTSSESTTFLSAEKKVRFGFRITGHNLVLGQKIEILNDRRTTSPVGAFLITINGSSYTYLAKNAYVTRIYGSLNDIIEAEEQLPDTATNFYYSSSYTTFTIQNTLAARLPFVVNASSRKIFDYVKTSNYSEVPISPKFTPIVVSTSELTDTLTSGTYPSKTDYVGYIRNSTPINAEPTKVRRWMGNIWEREQILVEAQ